MTSEEQAERIVKGWLRGSDTVVCKSMQRQLKGIIATGIRAAVAKAVAAEREAILQIEAVPTVLGMADIAEKQCEFEVAEWLRDYFWHNPQGERIRASGGNGGEEGEGK